MAVGDKIISAFSGPADPDAFQLEYPVPREKTHKIAHSAEATRLHSLYQSVRDEREGRPADLKPAEVWKVLKSNYPEEWLLPLEILELSEPHSMLANEIRDFLKHYADRDPVTGRLIENGLLLKETATQNAL
jgi:phenylalanine-4-hydroxylase